MGIREQSYREAERLIQIHGAEKAFTIANERRYNTESDSTAMHYDQVCNYIVSLTQ